MFIRIKSSILSNYHRWIRFSRALIQMEDHVKTKSGFMGLLLLGAIGLAPQSASAMPNGLPHVDQVSQIEQVRWVCKPWGRCWWRPNF